MAAAVHSWAGLMEGQQWLLCDGCVAALAQAVVVESLVQKYPQKPATATGTHMGVPAGEERASDPC